jgi:hypothetical protein
METTSNKIGGEYNKSRHNRNKTPHSRYIPSTRASSIATSTNSARTKNKQRDTTNLYLFG